jgi:integrase
MSLYKRRSGRWAVVLDVARGVAGVRRRKSLGVYRTKHAAEIVERAALSARDRGIEIAIETLTVADLFQRYFADLRPRVARTTMERYEDLAARSIVPRLGAVPIAKLRPSHLAQLYTDLLCSGRADGTGLSPRTVGYIATTLHAALRWAVKLELLGRNVADHVSPPKADRHEAHALSVAAAQRLLEGTRNDRCGPLWAFLLATGLRRGEVVALRWDDLDLEAATMVVRSSASFAFGEVREKPPKSGRARSGALSALALDALRTQKARQAQHRLIAGPLYAANDYVFADELGQPLHPRSVTSAFTCAARRLGLGTTSVHSLRHTCASWMIGGGVDVRTTAGVLGHSSANVTLAIYSHLLAGAQTKAVEVVADRLRGAG